MSPEQLRSRRCCFSWGRRSSRSRDRDPAAWRRGRWFVDV